MSNLKSPKEQIVECVAQLAERAKELGYHSLCDNLAVIVACSQDGDNDGEKHLTEVLTKFVEEELKRAKKTLKDMETNPDSPKNPTGLN